MLKAVNRLKKDSDFGRILNLADKKKFGPLLIFFAPKEEALRFGVVISKKVSKKAVVRNHLKRVIYNLLGEMLKEIKITGDFVIIVLYNPNETSDQIDKALIQWQKSL